MFSKNELTASPFPTNHDILQALKHIELVAQLLRNNEISIPENCGLLAETLEGSHKVLFEVLHEFLEKQEPIDT